MIRHSVIARFVGAAALVAAAFPTGVAASAPPSVTDFGRRDLLPTSPAVAGGAVGGLVNPAAWATTAGGEVAFWWNDRTVQSGALDNWGLSHGGALGFSVERRTFRAPGGRLRVHDFQLGLAGGDRRGHAGVAWRWSTGDESAAERESGFVAGSVLRPGRFVSAGLSGFLSTESGRRAALVDLGIRPLARPWLTLFSDYSLSSEQRPTDGEWSAGLEVRPVAGIHFGGRLREAEGADDLEWVLNVGVTLDRLGLHVLPGFDAEGDRATTTYLVRSNPPYRGLPVERALTSATGTRRFETIDLERKQLTYQRDLWFDDRRVAWIDLARRLRRLREDPTVEGVAIRISATRVRPSILWELRQELSAFRAAGKRVVIHFDRVRMGGYYLASVADHVVMDPSGDLEIVGIAAHRTYLKGLLEKLGIGFEEHRYFRYKSANERYTRSDMSKADREQIGREIDVIYGEIRSAVCEARGIAEAAFETIVDERAILFAEEARERGLVDAIGRWEDVAKWVKEEGAVLAGRPAPDPLFDERWGRPPTVAIVYADGLCEMDEGFGGRELAKQLGKLAKRSDVAAVVLRADSPGGDPLPAALVGDALEKVRAANKPAVVTQGDVAASGGYRIGTHGDRVYTTPLTVTGSIGVISGWAWDAGIGDKTGLSADGVQRGRHADLFAGIRFPLLGLRLPTRNLTDDERERVREGTMELYDDFVAAVAEGRGLSDDRVREVAEGRVWMGDDAIEGRLCDERGGLPDAIDRARRLAGLDDEDEFRLEEFPPRRRFRWPFPAFSPFAFFARAGANAAPASSGPGPGEDYEVRYLRMLADRPGAPLLLVPPEDLPSGWIEW